MKDKNNIIIVDTTLRDGEQTAGVVFANREKVRIAKFLNELGVHQIEAGIPVMGGDEKSYPGNLPGRTKGQHNGLEPPCNQGYRGFFRLRG